MKISYWVVRWGLSLFSVAIVFYLANTNSVSFDGVNIGFFDVLILSLMTVLIWLLRCFRLSIILSSSGKSPGLVLCFLAQSLEVCGNLLVPLRGGDLGRVALLSNQSDGGYKTQVIAYFFEKLMELFLSVVVLLLFLPYIWTEISPFVSYENLLILSFFSTLLIVVAGVKGYLRKLFRLLSKLSGLTLFVTVQPLIWTLLITILMRLVSALMFYKLACVTGLDIGLFEMVFVVSVVMLACAIPAAPGFIGTYQLAVMFSLGLLSVLPDESLVYSVVMHAWQMMAWLAMGGVGVLLYHISGINQGEQGENSIS
ncbi:MAG: flippase-like domain-containing protein [Gammaproteobacteria bacterium]|nr:flippase-like domain-containing protein [Gammaproteobacteria bacterium]